MSPEVQQLHDTIWLLFWLLVFAVTVGWRSEKIDGPKKPRGGDRQDGANR